MSRNPRKNPSQLEIHSLQRQVEAKDEIIQGLMAANAADVKRFDDTLDRLKRRIGETEEKNAKLRLENAKLRLALQRRGE